MKKKIILIYLLLFITSIAFSRFDCDIEGAGNIASTTVSFDDEDCKTADFDYVQTHVDGTIEEGTNTAADGPYGELDFSTWDCCQPA